MLLRYDVPNQSRPDFQFACRVYTASFAFFEALMEVTTQVNRDCPLLFTLSSMASRMFS